MGLKKKLSEEYQPFWDSNLNEKVSLFQFSLNVCNHLTKLDKIHVANMEI